MRALQAQLTNTHTQIERASERANVRQTQAQAQALTHHTLIHRVDFYIRPLFRLPLPHIATIVSVDFVFNLNFHVPFLSPRFRFCFTIWLWLDSIRFRGGVCLLSHRKKTNSSSDSIVTWFLAIDRPFFCLPLWSLPLSHFSFSFNYLLHSSQLFRLWLYRFKHSHTSFTWDDRDAWWRYLLRTAFAVTTIKFAHKFPIDRLLML